MYQNTMTGGDEPSSCVPKAFNKLILDAKARLDVGLIKGLDSARGALRLPVQLDHLEDQE